MRPHGLFSLNYGHTKKLTTALRDISLKKYKKFDMIKTNLKDNFKAVLKNKIKKVE